MPTAKAPINFVDNKSLIEEIKKSKIIQEENPDKTPSECLTPELVSMIVLMVDNYSTKGNFRGYSYLEDMKSEALMSLCRGVLKFDPNKSSQAFSYCTSIMTHAFLHLIEGEKKLRNIRDNILVQSDQNPSSAAQKDEFYNQDEHELDGTKRLGRVKRRRQSAAKTKPKKAPLKKTKNEIVDTKDQEKKDES